MANERKISTEEIREILRRELPPGERVTGDRLDEAAEKIKTVVAKAIDWGDVDHELGKGKRP
jgi:hypothetical protein